MANAAAVAEGDFDLRVLITRAALGSAEGCVAISEDGIGKSGYLDPCQLVSTTSVHTGLILTFYMKKENVATHFSSKLLK